MSLYLGICPEIKPIRRWSDPLLDIQIYQIEQLSTEDYNIVYLGQSNLIHRRDLTLVNASLIYLPNFIQYGIYEAKYGYMKDSCYQPRYIVDNWLSQKIKLQVRLIETISGLPEPICYDWMQEYV